MKVGIIDYGMGNIFSVTQALKRLACDYIITSDIDELAQVDALILPGVGAFPDAMKKLEEGGFTSYLQHNTKPLLGICLGMQLLFASSEEVCETQGLNLLTGTITAFSGNNNGVAYRVPHMGWNELQWQQKYVAEPQAKHVYFVHSYYATAVNHADIVATANYGGVAVPAIVQKNHITGMQFHPEKSGVLGMQLLQQWLEGVAK